MSKVGWALPTEMIPKDRIGAQCRQRPQVRSTTVTRGGQCPPYLLACLACVLALSCTASATSPDPNLGHRLAPSVFRHAVDRVMPAVVTIETFGGTFSLGSPSPKPTTPGTPGPPGSPSIRRFKGISQPGDGPTTGLIISPSGYILTSTYNFIRAPTIITVVLHDQSRHVARLLGRDETRGLCLLKIEPKTPLAIPTFVPRRALHVGQWAISIGLGYGGKEPVISVGIISATERIFGKAIQTDANISPANYGGPLIDIHGRVTGICVPLSPWSQDDVAAGVEWYDSGIGFAVSYPISPTWLKRLTQGHTIRTGRLGILPRSNDNPPGVKIHEVIRGSPAARAGIRKDDVIISAQHNRITDMLTLRSVLGRQHQGDTIVIQVRRGEKTITVKATLASWLAKG